MLSTVEPCNDAHPVRDAMAKTAAALKRDLNVIGRPIPSWWRFLKAMKKVGRSVGD
jgi:hypothetical protein